MFGTWIKTMACYEISALTQPHFGEVIRAGRMRHGWRTYRGAQAATGISLRLWSETEAGRNLTLRNAVRLLAAVDVP